MIEPDVDPTENMLSRLLSFLESEEQISVRNNRCSGDEWVFEVHCQSAKNLTAN